MANKYRDIPKKEIIEEDIEISEDGKVKVEKVIVGKVTKRKRNLAERIVLSVLGPDGLPKIGSYLGSEIIMPAIKNIIADSITSGINMAMFGEETSSRSSHSSASANRYASAYKGASSHAAPRRAPRTRDIEVFELSTRDEALQVLEELRNLIYRYDVASKADYLDAMGVDTVYTDNNIGWTNLDRVSVKMIRPNAFIIDLPRPEKLN